jgi:hypothetical protein
MGRKTTATDWEYAGILSVSSTLGLGGGGWVFSFRSTTADVWEDFVMLAAGAGTPGLSVEVGLPDFSSDDLSWSKIKCLVPFSASSLDCADASFTTEGVGAAFTGYSSLQLSVTRLGGPTLFSSQENAGFSAGVQFKPGPSFSAMAGKLYSIGTVARDYIVPVVNWSCWSVGAASGLVMAGDALLTGRGQGVLNVFAEGYAWMLAECTDPGTWTISESEREWYRTHKWEAAVIAAGSVVKQYGSKSPADTYDKAREAGKACIYQAMHFIDGFRGDKYYDDLCASHRRLYGQNRSVRQARYEQILWKQIKEGKTARQIGVSLLA